MSNRMPPVDLNKLKASDKEFISRVSKENLDRVAKLKRVRRNNWITFGFLGATVLGIYSYTIYSVKQETFLDDFNIPETTKPLGNVTN
ncbi:cytochrome c oxidase assembly factor 3, mitochondrial [Anthonomus grandis grandis]|uniref:cytochrome c oxidase assembly factor 3, mitochondrial n=1 Tax=Anthonomus grandis grandis TaxID=2921223 RepID=UPI0021655F2A|nr:cytochrome c oxidase assembly factor 3, mitochondrial [Anthonomus grandis grandis]